MSLGKSLLSINSKAVLMGFFHHLLAFKPKYLIYKLFQ